MARKPASRSPCGEWPAYSRTQCRRPAAKGEEVVLRYRLIVYRGGADAVPLAALWEEYRRGPPLKAKRRNAAV